MVFGRGRKKNRFLGYMDKLGRPVYGYSGTLQAWHDTWDRGDRAAAINKTSSDVMESLEDPDISDMNKAKRITKLDKIYADEEKIYVRALEDINAIFQEEQEHDTPKMDKKTRLELHAMGDVLQRELAVMAASRIHLGEQRQSFATDDEMAAWIRDNYKAGDTAASKSSSKKKKKDGDECDKTEGKKTNGGTKKRSNNAANWAKTKNGSMRITQKSYMGPFVVNWSTSGPSSVALRLGFMTWRIWSRNGSQPGMSSVDLPGPLSWRARR